MLVAASTNPSQAGAVNHSSIWSATGLGLPQNITCSLTVPRPETLMKSRTVGFFLPE
jgi:hypothetical protein